MSAPTDTSHRDLMDRDKGLTPTPTARELLTLLGMEDTVETLAARVEAVLALHWRKPLFGQPEDGVYHCAHCGVGAYWPCPTVRALNEGKP